MPALLSRWLRIFARGPPARQSRVPIYFHGGRGYRPAALSGLGGVGIPFTGIGAFFDDEVIATLALIRNRAGLSITFLAAIQSPIIAWKLKRNIASVNGVEWK